MTRSLPRLGIQTLCALALALALPGLAAAQPTLSKVFTPSTIGPGSVSTATFTITNNGASPVTGLAFTDNLPAAITLADPANAATDCDLGISGSLSAPDNGSTIALSGAQIGAGTTCTITVDVTASTPGMHTNPAVTLSSSAGSSMSLPIDLTVDASLPGFSKSFAPSSVSLGDRSTLTFLIDNSANGSGVPNLDFTDNLPSGMVIADPADASTTCGTATIPPTLTATAGTSVIILDANGTAGFPAVAANTACTVTVDVVSTGAGMLDNVSGELLAEFVSAGRASDTLEVTVTALAIRKSFTDDPVPPGGTVTLELVIDNFDRIFSATGVGFTDALAGALAGLTYDSLLANDCGGSVAGVGTTTVTFTGGTLAPEGSCTIRVSLTVPAAATPGAYTNTTGAVSGTVDGSPVVGNMASDDLFVEPVPVLTKEFLEVGTLAPNPVVNPGDQVVIRFTVTNTSTTSGATDVRFLDELTDGGPGTGFLPFPVTVSLPPTPDPPCGGGSSMALVSVDTDRQGLELTDGSLAAAGMAGDSCTFDVTVTIPAGLGPGVYLNTTEEPTATVDGATRTGLPASDTLTVIAAPSLVKVFTDDPVAPGGTVTLEFTLSYPPDASGDATAITFTDNLAPVLASLTATGLPIAQACDPDGPGGNPGTGTLSGSAGDTLLTFMGGTLMPGEQCTFTVTLSVPAGAAPGSYTNTTSGVGATVQSLPATSAPSSDDLDVAGLTFTKEFLGDPVIAGATLTLRFTINNIHPTDAATITFFTDNLAADLAGLAATGGPTMDTCGGSLSGTTFLTYIGGSVALGAFCVIEVPVLVPLAAADGTYQNITSSLSASQGGAVVIPPAVDQLTVDSNLLSLSKAFTDDPVAPGDPVTLEFTLSNLDATQAASMIDFTDDLGATLAGLTFDSVLFDDCGGTVSGTGTDMIMVMGASLAAGGTCTLRVSLTVPGGAAAGIYPNTTSTVTGDIGGFAVTGDAATDDLEVLQLLVFGKSFDGPTTATGSAVLTFTITNPGTTTAIGIGFTDDLNAVIPGLIATSLPALPCGAGSSITGIGFLTFTGGELPPMGGMCSFDVDVLVPISATAGTFPNTTSDLFRSGLPVSAPATADLVIEPPPAFAKAFAPNSIGLGLNSTLTFTIDNSASGLAASSLDFTDNLPAGVVVASPSVTSNTCGGTLTAVAASGTISLSGGTVAALASCTIQVDVTGTLPGTHVNTTGDLTSSSGNSGPASDTLTVNAPPAFAKVFAPDPIASGGVSTLTFTIDNTASTVATTLLDFTDNLPAALTVATPSNAATTCTGGTVTAVSGTSVVSYTGGTVGAGASCTVTADATSSTAGTHVNLSGNLTSSLGNSGTATDSLTVNPQPGFAKAFAPGTIAAGGVSTLTFTIDNTGSTVDATGLDFTDNLPAGVTVATPSNAATTCAGGTLGAVSGSGVITYTGGTATAGASCTVSVDVTSATTGMHVNLSGDLTSSLGTSGPATDTLDVTGTPVLGFTKVFLSAPVLPAGFVGLEFTITDNSGLDASGITFTDDLDAVIPGLVAIGLPAADVCGAGSSLSGTSIVTLTGGSLATGTSCTFQVNMQVPFDSPLGTFNNTTSALGFSVTGAPITGGPASADLDVAFLDIAKAFAPGPVVAGTTTTLSFTITNPDPVNAASGLTFTDDLDAVLPGLMAVGLPQNDVCGAGSQVSGTSVILLTAGTLPPGGICMFTVDVLVPTTALSGDYPNVTSALSATVNGLPVVGDPAAAATSVLTVLASVLNIPTLGEWALVLLAALLFLAAWRRLRMQPVRRL